MKLAVKLARQADRYSRYMSQLMPERRPDKHGNMVTRWIKMFTQRDSARNIPAPASANGIKKVRSNQAEIDDLCSTLQPEVIAHSSLLNSNAEFIADRDPEMLTRIIASAQSDTVEKGFWEHKLGRGSSMSNGNQADQERKLGVCRNSLIINPLLRKISDNGGDVRPRSKDPHQFSQIVGTIIEDGDLSHPPEELVQAITMIAYIRGLHTEESWSDPDGGYMTYKSIEKDAAFILDRIDQVEELLPELRARKSYDRETIELLLSAPSQSLMDGML